MNSFLFNVALILLCSISVIQFCTAFVHYAQATAAQEIFDHTLQSLHGIKYLYKYNVFQYGFVALPYSFSSTTHFLNGEIGNRQEGSSSQINFRFAL
uniref:Secreted protein n=1 Tax=Triticum urartu TaxID=4572 RepID=A0A8R7V105_TRIUA